jgi:PAS domain S-box-containing protein
MEEQDRLWLDKFFKTMYAESGIGIVIKGVDGIMLDCNPAFLDMLGYDHDEILERNYLELTHPFDRAMTKQLFDELVSGKRKNYIQEKRYLTKDEQTIWARINMSAVYTAAGKIQFAIGMVENITARKQMETEVVELRRRLMQGREMERLRLAQDLHDGPLQEILAAIIQLQPLEIAFSQDSDGSQFQSVLSSLHRLSSSIRNICGELRPPTLIPFGLEKAIRSNMDTFAKDHPEITVKLDLMKDGHTLSEQSRIVLYRVFQEALNNIVRHAKASEISVQFSFDDGHANLSISDNGIGFELPGRWIRLARQGHLGLVGCLERIEETGGRLTVTTAPGQGTSLHAILPLDVDNLEKEEM